MPAEIAVEEVMVDVGDEVVAATADGAHDNRLTSTALFARICCTVA